VGEEIRTRNRTLISVTTVINYYIWHGLWEIPYIDLVTMLAYYILAYY